MRPLSQRCQLDFEQDPGPGRRGRGWIRWLRAATNLATAWNGREGAFRSRTEHLDVSGYKDTRIWGQALSVAASISPNGYRDIRRNPFFFVSIVSKNVKSLSTAAEGPFPAILGTRKLVARLVATRSHCIHPSPAAPVPRAKGAGMRIRSSECWKP